MFKKYVFFCKNICRIIKNVFIFAPQLKNERPVRLAVRTPDFHSGSRGSIPLRATKLKANYLIVSLFYFILCRYCCQFAVAVNEIFQWLIVYIKKIRFTSSSKPSIALDLMVSSTPACCCKCIWCS